MTRLNNISSSFSTGNFSTINTEISSIINNLSGLTEHFDTMYYNLDGINADDILSTLENIAYLEQEQLKKEKLHFSGTRLTTINGSLNKLYTTYTTGISTYKNFFSRFNNLQNTRNILKTNLSANITGYNYYGSNLENLNNKFITFFERTIEYTGDNGQALTDQQTFGSNDFGNGEQFYKQLFQTYTQEDEAGTNKTYSGVQLTIQSMFIENNQDEPLKIPGLNILTPDRPIDSPRYVTFQGINAQEIKFIYPDLYKVEVYKTSNGIQTLKTIPEIKIAIQTYLQNQINTYNSALSAAQPTTQNSAAYAKLQQQGFTQAIPTNRTYQNHLFTSNDLLQALGGAEQLDTIAELLYYQNLTNTEKTHKELVLDDLNATKDTFDINNKVRYTLNEYLVQGKTKSPLVLPDYKEKGYEVAYINSDGSDYIRNESTPFFVTQALNQQQTFDTKKDKGNNNDETPSEQELQEQC
jgi:hypothetical protein